MFGTRKEVAPFDVGLIYRCPKKIVPFFLGTHCVDSDVSCTDCY